MGHPSFVVGVKVTWLTTWYRWPRRARTAYSEQVVIIYRQIVLSALLLVLLITQAGSSICGAQCVQRNLPGASAHGCHDMQKPQGAAVQTCPSAAHRFCAIDLLAGSQNKSVVLEHSLVARTNQLTTLSIVPFTPVYPPLRSSPGAAPRITPLRI